MRLYQSITCQKHNEKSAKVAGQCQGTENNKPSHSDTHK